MEDNYEEEINLLLVLVLMIIGVSGCGSKGLSDNKIKIKEAESKSIKYTDFDKVFLLFGKETKGLPEDILIKYIDKTIRIPMREGLRSLNLSNSVAIIVYEILRQVNFDGLQEISQYFD